VVSRCAFRAKTRSILLEEDAEKYIFINDLNERERFPSILAGNLCTRAHWSAFMRIEYGME
jgi:hypothetical protein